MKIVSWNVSGLRACLEKGFLDFFNEADADIFCVQETKMQKGQADIVLPGYYDYWNSAIKKGYSGTAVFTKIKPVSVSYGLGIAEHDNEGRVITLEFESFYLVNVYTPNSQRELARLDYRMKWENDFRSYIKQIDKIKPVIICGDLNVAHSEIDLKNPNTNRKNAGFTDEERKQLSHLLHEGFVDTFRYFYPDRKGAYTWWSYMYNARANNAGWRIDYFLASRQIINNVVSSEIFDTINGSDHCPIQLEIKESLMKDIELIKTAEKMRDFAYAPYSGYKVGAALLCGDGSVVTGCNIENASYGATICAERTAFSKAVSEGKADFEKIAIAVSGDDIPTPCGICRQFMSELADKNLELICISGTGEHKKFTLSTLFPNAFEFSKGMV